MASAAHRLTLLAFLTTGVGAWLPWWAIDQKTDAGLEFASRVHLFGHLDSVVRLVWPVVTGILVVWALLWLMVRIAAKSAEVEPHILRRDLSLIAGVLTLALASCWFWPTGDPAFWSSGTFGDGTYGTTHETARPGWGWWLALAGLAATVGAWWTLRSAPGPATTTDK